MFKYYKINNIKVINKIIGLNPTLKFSDASVLNDPFELKFNLEINPNSEISKIFYFNNFPNNNLDDYKVWQDGITENFVWYTEQEVRKSLAHLYNITCFSKKNDNNLMWSHYADNHKGICIEYSNELIEYLNKNEKFLASKTVDYSKNPPLLDTFESKENQVIKIFFNKQSEWSYEKEFRIILYGENQSEFIKIRPEHIKSVFIGSKCETHISNKIIDVCKKRNIKVFHAITMTKTYKIEFREHKDGTVYMKSFWR